MKYLHIISFDYPYPPNYGGVIDVFYKIKKLSECGVKIILHTFLYKRESNNEMEVYCEKVYYYSRKPLWQSIFSSQPMIVHSRRNDELIENLLLDEHPILFEGTHTCYYLADERLQLRVKLYRSHNLEHDYYQGLYDASDDFWKKIYYKEESRRLKNYFIQLQNADVLFSISKTEQLELQNQFSDKVVEYLPGFHGFDKVNDEFLESDFILYHGNLGVAENQLAALFLIEHIFIKLPFPIIIAGMNPSEQLKKICAEKKISLIQNSSSTDIDNLIRKARVNVLYTEQATGIKLKFLHVLFQGKNFVVNDKMLVGTGLEGLLKGTTSAEEMIQAILEAYNTSYTDYDYQKRKEYVKLFSNETNAKIILKYL